jgi:hypothetical protein
VQNAQQVGEHGGAVRAVRGEVVVDDGDPWEGGRVRGGGGGEGKGGEAGGDQAGLGEGGVGEEVAEVGGARAQCVEADTVCDSGEGEGGRCCG